MRAQPTSGFLRLRLRSLAEAIDDKLAGTDSRAVLFDDEPVDMRCRVPNCNTPLRMAQERAYRLCMGCQIERAG